ncbi:MAG: fused DSP-PTPase phosphatase/NAD kinase-like protein [Gemmatimonadales bacterium]
MATLRLAVPDLTNASEPIPGWVTGGQPTLEHLKALRDAGCEVVVDNRDPMEPRSYDEPAAVRAARMDYINLPIVHGAVTPAVMGKMHEQLRKLGGRRVLLHCNSGNRTAAGMIPYFMIDEGMDEEEAVDTAMRMGMRSAELVLVALEYVKSQTAKPKATPRR